MAEETCSRPPKYDKYIHSIHWKNPTIIQVAGCSNPDATYVEHGPWKLCHKCREELEEQCRRSRHGDVYVEADPLRRRSPTVQSQLSQVDP